MESNPKVIRTKLFSHQLMAVGFHLSKRASANWSEMGTGKTLISLSYLAELFNRSEIKSCLIVAPLSVMPTWCSEIEKHSNFTYTKLTGSIQKKIEKLKQNTDIYLISYDSIPGRGKTLGILLTALIQKKFDCLICDEASHIKNYRANRTKAITILSDKIKRKLFLSGTPIPNKPFEALTIYRAMDNGETFGRNFFVARNFFFYNHGLAYPDWRLRPEREKLFKEKLYKNAIRILKSDCFDLPPKIFTERYFYLTEQQINAYVPIAQEIVEYLRFEAGRVHIANSLVKLTKLAQITNGFIYTDKGVERFNPNPKLELLREVLENEILPTEDKFIIITRWKEDIENIKKLLEELKIPTSILQGSTKDRDTQIKNFYEKNTAMLMMSAVGAYGLNLEVANYVIYYSLSFSLSEFVQSQDRVHRIGQTKPCVYITLIGDRTIDKYIYSILQRKVELSQSLLDKEERNCIINILKQNFKEE